MGRASGLGWIVGVCCLAAASRPGRLPAQDTAKPAPAAATSAAVPASPAASPAAANASAGTPAATPPAPTPAASPLEAQPPLYYLPDKRGNLQPVPGFSYEEFMELYRLKSTGEQRHSGWAFEELQITGTVQGERAQLTVHCKVAVEGTERVRVPLRFNQAIVREPLAHEGPNAFFLAFDAQRDGYTCWLTGSPTERVHELTGEFLVPLDQAGGGQRLRLLLPRAARSEIKLQLPVAKAVTKVSEGSILQTVKASGANGTEVTVLGAGGEWELAWWPPGSGAHESRAELEAVGLMLARLDGRELGIEATLNVRSYGRAFERFRVRLPHGAELVASDTVGYAVVPAEAKQAAAGEHVVEVQLARKTTGPVEVQLATRQPYDASKASDWLELGGFEVVQAVRQRGHVAVAVAGDWHVLWGPSRGVRRVDQWPEALRFEDVVAGFEYFTQPYALNLRLVPRKTHVFVEPEYLVLVDPDQVRLEARLKYTVRGARVFALEVKLGEWQFDQVEPENLVAVDALQFNPSQSLSIPLQQPSTGQIELLLKAHQPLPKKGVGLALSLPQPVANSQAAARLAVLPADNVELTPDAKATTGLVREASLARMQLPERQQEPLWYRMEGSKGLWAAQMAVRPRRVEVESAATVTLQREAVQVQQRLRYSIAYESLDRLTLELPRGLAGSEGFGMQWKGQAVRPVPLPEPEVPKGHERPATVRLSAALPKAQVGSGELLLSYTLPLAEMSLGEEHAVSVPLAFPFEASLSAQRATVVAGAGYSPQEPDAPWTAANDPLNPPTAQALHLESSEPARQIAFHVRRSAEDAVGTVIERAWIQSWLTPTARQDRAVYRFSTADPELRLKLPEGAAWNQMLLLLDGRRVVPQWAAAGELTIAWPAAVGRQQHDLELRYQFPEGRPTATGVDLAFPQFGHDVWTRRLFWQLVLPPGEHLLRSPAGFTREYAWAWSGLGWNRQPVLAQAQLEAWSGATRQASSPLDANRYLFSSMGAIPAGHVATVPQAWIVLWAAGAALVAGLLLVHVPRARHPAGLLTAAVLVLAAGALDPELALLFGQAAVGGLILALLGGLLQQTFAWRRRRIEIRSGPLTERRSTEPYQGLPAGSKSTPTASAAPPPATMEWSP